MSHNWPQRWKRPVVAVAVMPARQPQHNCNKPWRDTSNIRSKRRAIMLCVSQLVGAGFGQFTERKGDLRVTTPAQSSARCRPPKSPLLHAP